ncbi:YdiU family protein [Rhodovulum sp. 12E13]|uniref:protein adenylyltransferase SelO n=1 Tax=Rhodovulum sp. 12E13 TaxID=2203891 RepID=UPI000E1A67E1|nr:YdiU family protein [Rhodovulum sp. 12E13]RDC73138.1 YdiU family protein [Rhodovulum sp. 12E13]
MNLHVPFDNTYAALPERFYTKMAPEPVKAPEMLLLNRALAQELGIDPDALLSDEGVAVLAGNAVPEGADPLAQVYAGHQFGGFSPQLGDGRAILLGEIVGRDGRRRDLQLKGSGRTPYSRMGDGRAWIGPVIREFLVSEAMHALGVPTTRALAAVATGETVLRERPFPGGVLTRVASSHIRVGTFQFFAARGDTEALRALTDYAIARHYPQADGPLALLEAVIDAQARLVAQWMGLGFIHGVMNTDNTAVSGETIDYGPCAFMDAYHPATVFSSIDHGGRYAYARQPEILAWNLAQFATCLLPLIDADPDRAVARAQAAMDRYPERAQAEWARVFRAKLGLAREEEGDADLAIRLLEAMAAARADFTNVFRGLADGTARDWFADRAPFEAWEADWQARLAREEGDVTARLAAANPAVIPRNHRVEEAIRAALGGDLEPARALHAALSSPFADPDAKARPYTRPPEESEVVHATFCGT